MAKKVESQYITTTQPHDRYFLADNGDVIVANPNEPARLITLMATELLWKEEPIPTPSFECRTLRDMRVACGLGTKKDMMTLRYDATRRTING